MHFEPWSSTHCSFLISKDLTRTRAANRRLARSFWAETGKDLLQCAVSEDYVDGFCEGFADHLDYGGRGLPPILPPRRYWGSSRRLAADRLGGEEWLDGFALGAIAARESGLRELATVPVFTYVTEAESPIVDGPFGREPLPQALRLSPIDAELSDPGHQPLESANPGSEPGVSPAKPERRTGTDR